MSATNTSGKPNIGMEPKENRWTKVVYVAGPYKASNEYRTKNNIRMAEEVGTRLWYCGFISYVPHLNTAFFRGAYGLEDDVWLNGHLVILRRCDLLVVLPGWEQSPGTIKEIKLAEELGIPIYYWANNFDRYKLEYYYEQAA